MPACIDCIYCVPDRKYSSGYGCDSRGFRTCVTNGTLYKDDPCPNFIPRQEKTESKEEKKMATTRKTKDELMTELEAKETEIKELKEDLKKLEKYKQYEDMAGEIRALNEAFMNSGFSDEQAFAMVNNILTTATAGVVKNPLAFLR